MPKVSIQRKNRRIRLPQEFAFLEKITPQGNFVYKFRYLANIHELLGPNNNDGEAIVVNIRVMHNEAAPRTVKVFDQGFNPDAINNQIQKLTARQADLNKQILRREIIRKRSDISKDIPNDRVRDIRRETHVAEANERTPLRTFFSTDVLATTGLNADNKVAPILESNLVKPSREQEIDPRDSNIREASLGLLFNELTDPAEYAGRRTNTIAPASKQHAGVKTDTSFFLEKNETDKDLIQQLDVMIKSLLTRTEAATHHKQLPPESFVNVVTKVDEFESTIEEIIEIPGESLTNDKFRVELDLVNSKGLIVQKLKGVVYHSRNVARLRTPTKPPKLSGFQLGRKGRNVLRVTQVDENATGIAVYKKTVIPWRFNLNDQWRRIQLVDHTADKGERFLEDVGVSENPTIYRAFAVSPDGKLSSQFSSVVLRSERTKTSLEENWKRRPRFLTLSHEIQETTVVLFVDNIPNGPIALELFEKDLTLRSSFEKVGRTALLNKEPTRPLEFQKERLKVGHVYEYQCRLTYRDGAVVDAGNNLIVEYSPLENNIINVDVLNLQIDSDNDDDIDVRFDIKKDITLTDTDKVKALLAERGITEFSSEFEKNKSRLQDLFFIRIERANLITGEVEDFGIIDGLNFSDKVLGQIQGVTPLEPATAYKYAVFAHARAAETIIPELSRSVVTGPNSSYSLKPGKFLHPLYFDSKGTLLVKRLKNATTLRALFP